MLGRRWFAPPSAFLLEVQKTCLLLLRCFALAFERCAVGPRAFVRWTCGRWHPAGRPPNHRAPSRTWQRRRRLAGDGQLCSASLVENSTGGGTARPARPVYRPGGTHTVPCRRFDGAVFEPPSQSRWCFPTRHTCSARCSRSSSGGHQPICARAVLRMNPPPSPGARTRISLLRPQQERLALAFS